MVVYNIERLLVLACHNAVPLSEVDEVFSMFIQMSTCISFSCERVAGVSRKICLLLLFHSNFQMQFNLKWLHLYMYSDVVMACKDVNIC